MEYILVRFEPGETPKLNERAYGTAFASKACAILDVIYSANSLHCENGKAEVRIQFIEQETADALWRALTDR